MKGHRRWVVAGLLASVVAGGIAPAAAGGTSATGNQSRAQSEAARLLDLIQLPPNVSQSATEPSGDGRALAAPGYNLATPDLVDAHAWWTAPGKAGDVVDYVASHLPNGTRWNGRASGNIAPGYEGESWSFSAVPGVLSQRVIAVTVVQLTANSVGVRTDGEAVWIVPRPAWEVVPAGVRRVTVRAVSTGLPPGSRTLSNGGYTLTGTKARQLVSFINRLPRVQPGTRFCPAGFYASVHLRFLSARGRTLATALESPTGCASVSLTVRGRLGPALDDYPSVTSELKRLLARH